MLNKLFWFIPFWVSFATTSGELNENFYIKSFAFELIFIVMFILNSIKGRKIAKYNVSICLADLSYSKKG